MTAYDFLATAAGVVGVTAGAVFAALWWRLAGKLRRVRAALAGLRRELMRNPALARAAAITPEYRPGGPVSRPRFTPGQTVVLPPQPAPRRHVNGGN